MHYVTSYHDASNQRLHQISGVHDTATANYIYKLLYFVVEHFNTSVYTSQAYDNIAVKETFFLNI